MSSTLRKRWSVVEVDSRRDDIYCNKDIIPKNPDEGDDCGRVVEQSVVGSMFGSLLAVPLSCFHFGVSRPPRENDDGSSRR